MKRILLPTDFSEDSFNAIQYALQLMQSETCTFVLLHTYTPPMISTHTMLDSSAVWSIQKSVEDNARRNLDDLSEKLQLDFPNTKHSFKTRVSFNLLVPEMGEVVLKDRIDLVIMATQGATGAKEIFLGTNTMYAIKHLKIPVLAVPARYSYQIPKQILFATDYSASKGNLFFSLLRDLAQTHRSHIQILNSYFGVPLRDSQIAFKDYLNTYFKDIIHIFHVVDGKEVLDAIEHFESENTIDLLVMVHNKHNFFENLLFNPTINKIVYHTKVPFLVIPSIKQN
ncbi:nucleotide-binding universal stress UspA family protein [Leeuwenhoekiella aestuarii]|uniref:Nucleotide-binding universal stress UspA family protein n=1 Tax=Leeuwenhoekiella aestuarii TaxID=2249426 RepID=A0A4Q0NUF6_9FLAO|nr:universal stress protein [Leeuwenhoekiella aestuarii]RXG11651.1 nucleotide-binding universal stress UspA family protein [Leeuwenhoekiella aestuarii]RXG15138.1 nucleotide-binding universal stress UspA family protein [Leeuwenhoekiella aestuarii]